MLIDGEWDGYVELVAFSELFNIQIQVYDSLSSQQPITTVSTVDGGVTIVILFSGYHDDSQIPRFHEETDLIEHKELSDTDNDEIATAHIRKTERDDVYVYECPTTLDALSAFDLLLEQQEKEQREREQQGKSGLNQIKK